MERDHAVNWVCLVTDKGSQRKRLEVGKEPKVTFLTEESEKILGAFAYCNLHGLWVSEVDKEGI
jgi:superoxide reductase